jgi:hypothetical protein
MMDKKGIDLLFSEPFAYLNNVAFNVLVLKSLNPLTIKKKAAF